jgi:hypothetical protein
VRQDLDGLTLRTAETRRDVEAAAEFNGLIHEPELAPAVLDLMSHYPGIDHRDLILVEDKAGQIVSSMLLIPWTLSYEGVPLRVGEMGMVGTLEPYRRRGLVRAQDAIFKRRLVERGCLLSLIQGIPYFLDHAPALATLRWLKRLAAERGKPGVRLNLPASCSLVRLARSLGGHDLGTYAWQVHVADFTALLAAIGPVLERRLAASPFAGLSKSLILCFYRESVTIRFDRGWLAEVTPTGPCDGGLRFPPSTFIPVLLGWRTVEEMRLAYPDLSVPDEDRLLTGALFPPLAGFLYPSY